MPNKRVGWVDDFVPAAEVPGGLRSDSFGATTEQGDSPFSGLHQRAALIRIGLSSSVGLAPMSVSSTNSTCPLSM